MGSMEVMDKMRKLFIFGIFAFLILAVSIGIVLIMNSGDPEMQKITGTKDQEIQNLPANPLYVEIDKADNVVTLNKTIIDPVNKTLEDKMIVEIPYSTGAGWLDFDVESAYPDVDVLFILDNPNVELKTPQILDPKLAYYEEFYSCDQKDSYVVATEKDFKCFMNNVTAKDKIIFQHAYDRQDKNTFYWTASYVQDWQDLKISRSSTETVTKTLTKINNQYIVRAKLKEGKNKLRVFVDIAREGWNVKTVETEYWVIIQPVGLTVQSSLDKKYYIDPFINSTNDAVNFTHLENVKWWSLDEATGTNAKEKRLGVENITVTASWNTTNKILGASSYHGVDGIVTQFGGANVINATNNVPFSVSLWAYSTNLAGYKSLFDFRNDRTFECYLNTAVLGCEFGSNNTNAGFTASTNTWYHYVFSFDGTATRVYVNGTLVKTVVNSINTDTGTKNSLGQQYDNSFDWLGEIDEFAVWTDVALNSSDVTMLYNNGLGRAWNLTGTYPTPPTPNTVNTTLFYPIDYYNQTTPSVNFYCNTTTTDTSGILNITFILDGADNYTAYNTTSPQNLSLNYTVNISGGNHTWTCRGASSINSTTASSRIFTLDISAPVITNIWNITSITTNKLPINSTWNFTVSDAIPNTCWYYKINGFQENLTGCIQPFANVSTCGNSIHNYSNTGGWVVVRQVYDGDWTSGSCGNASGSYVYANYSLPSKYDGASIKLLDGQTFPTNLTYSFPSNCISNNLLQMRVFSRGGTQKIVTWSCNNGTDWYSLRNYTSAIGGTCEIYDWNIIWNNTANYVTCNSASLQTQWNTEGGKTILMYANDSASRVSSNSSSLWVYFWNYTMNESKDPVGEGESVTYTLQVNITDMQTRWAESNATFTFNNTVYQPDTETGYANYTIYTKTINMADGLGNITGRALKWNWTFNIQNTTTKILAQNTETSTTSVYSVAFDDCSSYSRKILNLSLKDEETANFMNKTTMTIELDLNASRGTDSWSYHTSYTADNTNGTAIEQIAVCVPDGLLNATSYKLDFIVGYVGTDYVQEFYYMDNGTLDNSTNFNSYTDNTVDLYDLLSADSTTFLFKYTDENNQEVDDIIVHTFRKYIGEGVYREVERSKQDDSGQTHVHLVEEDVIYYFMITQYGRILYTSGEYNAKCLSTPCEISLSASPTETNWSVIDNEGGQYSVSTDKSTRTVTVTFALDHSAKVNATVFKFMNGSVTYVTGSSLTASAGSISLNIPIVYDNSTFFVAIYNNDEFVKSVWINLWEDAKDYFGTSGAILGGLIVLAMVLMAVTEGAGLIIFTILAILIIGIMQLVDLSWMAIISIICAGGIIVWKLVNRRGTRQ